MFYISKRMEIAGAHNLSLDYESKCKKIHGHNWIVTVYCRASKLNRNSMIVDFKQIKNLVHEPLDHSYVNEVITGMNPTAENIAMWICNAVNDYLEVLKANNDGDAVCTCVTVQESEGNVAKYESEL